MDKITISYDSEIKMRLMTKKCLYFRKQDHFKEDRADTILPQVSYETILGVRAVRKHVFN